MSGHVATKRSYYLVFAVLAGLTVLTVTASLAELGRYHVVVALTIAVAKALLVALFFMHLIHARRVVALAAAAALFWLAILISLTLCDYLSRDWLGRPLPGLVGRGPSSIAVERGR